MQATSVLKILQMEPASNTEAIRAQYNPKELQIDTAISYKPQEKRGPYDFEFTQRDPSTMQVELLFDGFEQQLDVKTQIEALRKLIENVPELRRPPKVSVIWGQSGSSMPRFDGIIEKVSVKYQMFAPDGTVLRATATVSFKEAKHTAVGKKK